MQVHIELRACSKSRVKENVCMWNPESELVCLVESVIMGFRMAKFSSRRNAANDGYLES